MPLWDGNTGLGVQYDPAFVGEYLRTQSPAKGSYRDWRLIPGSPMQNQGRWTSDNWFVNSVKYPEPECAALKVSLWDHESYGNPRIVDGSPDIGFDEVQLGVLAGSYANHSYSHNRQGALNPQVPDEQDTRFLLLRHNDPGGTGPLAGRSLSLVSNEIVPGTGYRAWTLPPGSLTAPSTQSGSVVGYDQLYTSTSPGGGVPWMQSFTTPVPVSIPWPNWQAAPASSFGFGRVALPQDDEGAGFASWANIQPRVTAAGFLSLFGTMQPEYR